jgi:hypothetical protein
MKSRTTSRSWVAIAAGLAFVSMPALAVAEDGDVQSRLTEMRSRMQQMEDKLQAASDQLDTANQRVEAQSQLIEKSGLANTRGASSGLPGFLGEITIGGWVQASYLYNLNDPNDSDHIDGLNGDDLVVVRDDDGNITDVFFEAGDGGLGGTNQGVDGLFYPYTPDHNSFSFDQVWLELERPIDEEHRAGFRFDMTYGKTAAQIGGPSNRGDGIRDDTALYVFAGYVQYLAPIGDGLTFKMGKFGTPIGNEYAQAIYNWNITHSSVFNLLQPLDHIGITAEYAFGDTGFDALVGGVNGFLPDDPDRNDAKSVLGHVGWENDSVSIGLNGIYGAEGTGHDGAEGGVLDAVINITATDRLAFWINGDYRWSDSGPEDWEDAQAWGVAAAGRFGITERTGIALRGEYVSDINRFFFNEDFGGDAFGQVTGMDVWGVTLTLQHLLTDHLQIRGEVRYDNVNKDSGENDEFFEDSEEFENDQIVIGADVIYNFNKFGGE